MNKIDVVFDWRGECAKGAELGTVSVRVYRARKRTYISTGVRVRPDQWSDKLYVIHHPDAVEMNDNIMQQVDRCKAMVNDAVRNNDVMPSAERMKVDRSDASFLDWLDKQIEYGEMSEGTRRHHKKVLRSLCAFGRIRRFDDVKDDRVNEWLRWVGTRTIKKVVAGHLVTETICQSTKHDYYKVLKKWVAVAQCHRMIKADALVSVKCSRGKSKPRVYLTDDELQAWMSASANSPHLIEARDRFIIESGTGMAYSDFIRADFSKIEEINGMYTLTDTRRKTAEEFFVIILPWAYDKLKEYNFNVPAISNQKYNLYLKAVAAAAGIDKVVTSHVARHTYATYLINHGVRLESIQRMLGHSSIKTTQIYARMNKESIVNDVKKIF